MQHKDRLGIPLTREVRDAVLAAYVYGRVTAGQRDRSHGRGRASAGHRMRAEVTEADAPVWMAAEQAYGWACGWNAAMAVARHDNEEADA